MNVSELFQALFPPKLMQQICLQHQTLQMLQGSPEYQLQQLQELARVREKKMVLYLGNDVDMR